MIDMSVRPSPSHHFLKMNSHCLQSILMLYIDDSESLGKRILHKKFQNLHLFGITSIIFLLDI